MEDWEAGVLTEWTSLGREAGQSNLYGNAPASSIASDLDGASDFPRGLSLDLGLVLGANGIVLDDGSVLGDGSGGQGQDREDGLGTHGCVKKKCGGCVGVWECGSVGGEVAKVDQKTSKPEEHAEASVGGRKGNGMWRQEQRWQGRRGVNTPAGRVAPVAVTGLECKCKQPGWPAPRECPAGSLRLASLSLT